MSEAKDHVVVMLDGYNDCGLNEYAGILGPYTKDEAEYRCAELKSRDLYAQDFRVEKLGATHHHTDDWADNER